MTRGTTTLLAALLVVTLLTPAALAQTRTTIDDDHALESEGQQAAFVQEGVATADLTAPDMQLTVATEHDDAGCEIDGFHSDLRNDYLCVEYTEEVDRTIRLYVPAEYWTPYVRENVSPVAGDQSATFEPIRDNGYTKVTFQVTEPGTYAWKINAEASLASGAKERTLENIEKVTGVGMPNASTWSYIKPEQLAGNNSAYVVRAPNGTDALVMEYQTASGEWAQVPDEAESYAPVYYETKNGVDDRVYVFATSTEAPEVRYKTEAAATTQIGAAIRQIGQIPTRVEDIFGIDIPFLGG